MAYSTLWPANARAVTSKPLEASPSSRKSPFFVPTSNSVIYSASRDGGEHVDPVVGCDRRPLLPLDAVDEHVDVLADASPLVEHPAADRRMLPLEGDEHLAHGRAGDRVQPPAAQLGERSAEHHLRHRA